MYFHIMKSILVIEDNAALRENTVELLELAGYKVLEAKNGKTGLEQALNNPPDVILCDIMMPELDGAGFLKLIKKEKTTSNIPVIFFSAGSMPHEIQKNLDKESDGFLRKPFTNEELQRAIERCLDKNGS